MVRGIEKFRTCFSEDADKYILIGGTACAIHFDAVGVEFRATKDLDIVILVEALTQEFVMKFWQFVEDGGYEQRYKSSGEKEYYRFIKPRLSDYPSTIELFSRTLHDLEYLSLRCTPITVDDGSLHLSSIIIENDYYDFLLGHAQTIGHLSVLDLEGLILLKMKAWVNQKKAIERGEIIHHEDIKKHRNDVFRLLQVAEPGHRVIVSETIQKDIHEFILL